MKKDSENNKLTDKLSHNNFVKIEQYLIFKLLIKMKGKYKLLKENII